MPAPQQVHWAEGLFLQPHHLQLMQRQMSQCDEGDRRLAFSHPYGLIQSKLFAGGLANKQVRFNRLHAIMPSGREIDYPNNADLAARDIKAVFDAGNERIMVYLAVPTWEAGRPNLAGADGSIDRGTGLYKLSSIEERDENTGENPQTLQVRRINARLLLDGDNIAGMEVLPVLRVGRGVGNESGQPIEDKDFIPPSLLLSAAGALKTKLDDLVARLEASRTDRLNKMRGGGFTIDGMRGEQMGQLLHLQVLFRFSIRLGALAMAPATPPALLYAELCELLGEFAALRPDRTDLYLAADYHHDEPTVPFNDLIDRIIPLLSPLDPRSNQRVPFVREGPILTCAPDHMQLISANQFFLAIKSAKNPREVADVVENRARFKLMSPIKIKAAISGIKLAEERAPEGLPTPGGIRYFQLLTAADQESKEMWDTIRKEGKLALYWPTMAASDFEVSLYMMLPKT